MQYKPITVMVLVLVAGGGYYLKYSEPTRTDDTAPARANDTDQLASSSSTSERQPSAREALADQYGLSEQQVQRRLQEREYRDAAEARFNEAVKMDGLRPDDVDPAVRKLFETLELEPAFDPGHTRKGKVKGMRIERLGNSNPLARAGFRTGDLLTRINGESLRDPARIAHLVTRLDRHLDVCVLRSGERQCAAVQLQP